MGIDPTKKVPARFKGHDEHILPAEYGPYFDASGNPYMTTVSNADTKAPSLGVVPDSELMVYPHEVYGMTFWHDPHGNQPSINLGVGKVTFPGDVGKTAEELARIGYEFHEGRSDMEPLISFADLLAAQEPPTSPVVQEVQHTGNTQPLPIVEPVETSQPA